MLPVNILKKEFKEARWILLIGLVILIGYGFSNVIFYEMTLDLIKTAPKDLDKMMNYVGVDLSRLADEVYYFYINWFGQTIVQMGVLFTILLGMRLIASEKNVDSIGFLLTKPFTRGQVLFAKFLGGYLPMLILLVLPTVAYKVILKIYDYNLPWEKVILGTVLAVIGLTFIYVISLFFSVITSNSIVAGLGAVLVSLALSLPGWFKNHSEYSLYYYMKGQSILQGDGFPWLGAAVIVLATVILYFVTNKIFTRKDF